MKGAANKTFWIIKPTNTFQKFSFWQYSLLYSISSCTIISKKDKAAFQNCVIICVSFFYHPYMLTSLTPPSNGGCCDAKCQSSPDVKVSALMCKVFDGWCSFSKLCLRHFRCIQPPSFRLQVYVFNLTSKRVKMWLEDGWECCFFCRSVCECVRVLILNTHFHHTYSTSKVRSFLGSEDFLAFPLKFKGLFGG